VVSVERIKNLADLAKMNLKPLRRSNLKLMFGDGLVVAAPEGPFDVILFSAGMADIPREMLTLLAEGGVLVAPVGEPEQHLMSVQKTDNQQLKSQAFDMVRYVPVLRGTE
jgi:protein-L-isoaspartate(D-aspartate) O-methyltransferase